MEEKRAWCSHPVWSRLRLPYIHVGCEAHVTPPPHPAILSNASCSTAGAFSVLWAPLLHMHTHCVYLLFVLYDHSLDNVFPFYLVCRWDDDDDANVPLRLPLRASLLRLAFLVDGPIICALLCDEDDARRSDLATLVRGASSTDVAFSKSKASGVGCFRFPWAGGRGAFACFLTCTMRSVSWSSSSPSPSSSSSPSFREGARASSIAGAAPSGDDWAL